MVLHVQYGQVSIAKALTNYVTRYWLQFLHSLHERSTLSNAELPEPTDGIFVEIVFPSARSVSAWNVAHDTAIILTPV